jgi:hypothetical protein
MLVPVLQLISPVCKTGTSLFFKDKSTQLSSNKKSGQPCCRLTILQQALGYVTYNLLQILKEPNARRSARTSQCTILSSRLSLQNIQTAQGALACTSAINFFILSHSLLLSKVDRFGSQARTFLHQVVPEGRSCENTLASKNTAAMTAHSVTCQNACSWGLAAGSGQCSRSCTAHRTPSGDP